MRKMQQQVRIGLPCFLGMTQVRDAKCETCKYHIQLELQHEQHERSVAEAPSIKGADPCD